MSDKLEALKAKKPLDTKTREAEAAGYVTDDNSGGYYVVECQECGEVYPSQQCDGGGPIADTGDYNDALCPHCGCESPEECNDTPLVWNVQQAKINALLAALEEKDQQIKELEEFAKLALGKIPNGKALPDFYIVGNGPTYCAYPASMGAEARGDLAGNLRKAYLSPTHWMERANAAEQRLQQSIELPDARSQEYWFDAVFQRQKFDRDVEKHIHALNLRLRSRGE
jgi:hypothetical protein